MSFKYTTTFSSILRPLVSEEKDKYLALASLIQVGNFIPEVNTEKNVDLLPVAFNAAVVNRVNKNGDVIDTETAIAAYKDFINKPINIEHNRERIVGVILTAGFSEFGSDVSLSEEQVKDLKGPFNITLGGVIWKISNPSLAEKIEESSDETSDQYQKISASWELGFNDYNLVVIEGESKNIEDGTNISDASQIESMRNSLRAFGGSGKLDKNKSIYRKVIGNVVPLGIGLTETPAADVKGVATLKIEAKEQIIEENISKIDKLDVNTNIENNVMKIQSIKDITDESLKQATASQISDLIEQELKSASEKFAAEKASVETALQAAKEQYATLQANQETLEKEIAALKASLEASEVEKQKILAAEKFNERMSAFDSEYDLDDESRQVIASDIADLDDDAFAAYKNKMAVFMKNKKKNSEDKGAKEDKKEDAKASVDEVLDNASEKGEKKAAVIAATSTASESSLFEKYKQAFNYDGFVIG